MNFYSLDTLVNETTELPISPKLIIVILILIFIIGVLIEIFVVKRHKYNQDEYYHSIYSEDEEEKNK